MYVVILFSISIYILCLKLTLEMQNFMQRFY